MFSLRMADGRCNMQEEIIFFFKYTVIADVGLKRKKSSFFARNELYKDKRLASCGMLHLIDRCIVTGVSKITRFF
jgi:hypothetical protein